jgi:thiol-disulfide isomerase/thioredoxin
MVRMRAASAVSWRVLAWLALLAGSLLGHAASTTMVFFWGEGCPHCAAARPVLDALAGAPDVTLRSFEVYGSEENRFLMAAAGRAFGFDARAVPVILIGDEVFVGYAPAMERTLAERVATCRSRGCPDPMARILASLPGEAPGVAAAAAPATAAARAAPVTLRLPVFGEVRLSGRSHLASTALIALVDGFNPCSLWVLSLLLAVVINSGSRRTVLMVGVTFLTVSATVYALFIAGLVNVLAWAGMLPWVRVAVALLALGFALVNIKDYVWLRRGPSLTIPESGKPAIYRGIRSIMSGRGHPLAMVGATAGMAAGVTLFELPCTVGFPVLWANLVVQWSPGLVGFSLLLAVYLVVFLLDELALFGVALVTLRVTRLEEGQGRVLKLVGGTVMLALALVLVFRPEMMNQLGSALGVVGGAVAVALIVHLLVRLGERLRLAVTTESASRSAAPASRAARRPPPERRGR